MLKIKNWDKYQHYKDRCPPWIKLDTGTFQNYDFARLQDASKLLAICIWTLAARSKEGEVPPDFEWIKSQCGLGSFVNIDNLKELINKGFIIDASNALASCLQDASPETETETETETEEEEEEESCFYSDNQNQDSFGAALEKFETAQTADHPPAPPDEKNENKNSKKEPRGIRLKKFLDDYGEDKAGKEFGDWARKEGFEVSKINFEMQKFCDYWNAQPGQRGVKLDWPATWRNWIRKVLERKQREEQNAIRYGKR